MVHSPCHSPFSCEACSSDFLEYFVDPIFGREASVGRVLQWQTKLAELALVDPPGHPGRFPASFFNKWCYYDANGSSFVVIITTVQWHADFLNREANGCSPRVFLLLSMFFGR